MKAELEVKLAEEFPFMRRGKNAKAQIETDGRICNIYDAYGCEFSDGWYDIIRGLCRDISMAHEKAGVPIDIVVDQVKEKFGTLRFYYHPAGHDPGIHAFDFLSDGLSIRKIPGVSDLHKAVAEIVHKWEKESVNVCERCGASGELRKGLRRVSTLCDSCYEQLNKK